MTRGEARFWFGTSCFNVRSSCTVPDIPVTTYHVLGARPRDTRVRVGLYGTPVFVREFTSPGQVPRPLSLCVSVHHGGPTGSSSDGLVWTEPWPRRPWGGDLRSGGVRPLSDALTRSSGTTRGAVGVTLFETTPSSRDEWGTRR